MRLTLNNFFSHLITRPWDAKTKRDIAISSVASAALGILSGFLIHAVSFAVSFCATKSKITSVNGFPTRLSHLKTLNADLGGTTHPKLVEDVNGKFVMKSSTPRHLVSEYLANKAYKSLKVPVPEVALYVNGKLFTSPIEDVNDFDNKNVVMLSQYIEGTRLDKLPIAQSAEVFKKIQKHFIVDCLLGNWDAVGYELDNIIVDKEGSPWRIDNGACFEFTASGKLKAVPFSTKVPELHLLRKENNSLSISLGTASAVYKTLTPDDLYNTLQQVKALRNEINLPDTYLNTVQSRLDFIDAKVNRPVRILSPRELEENKESVQIITEFWKEHVDTFHLNHGTSALYFHHFKKYGLSSTYPPQLESAILRIRTVWNNHQDVMAKTNYWCGFEKRYEESRLYKDTTVSFSISRTHEYTHGERRYGGEWIKELKEFLKRASEQLNKFSDSEKEILLDTEALIQAMGSLPAMIVKLKPRHFLTNGYLTRSFPSLEEYIANFVNHKDWKDPLKLHRYLLTQELEFLNEKKKRISGEYEYVLQNEVAPENLEIEIIRLDRSKITIIPSTDYPKLKFDEPIEMSADEISKLDINSTTYLSTLPEYSDSVFECKYRYDETLQKSIYTVTRRKPTQKDIDLLNMLNQKEVLRKKWLETFGCSDLDLGVIQS